MSWECMKINSFICWPIWRRRLPLLFLKHFIVWRAFVDRLHRLIECAESKITLVELHCTLHRITSDATWFLLCFFFSLFAVLLSKFTDHKVVHFLYLLTMISWTSYSPVALIHCDSRKFNEIIAQIKINNFEPNILVSTIFSSCDRNTKYLSFTQNANETTVKHVYVRSAHINAYTHRYRVDACFYTQVVNLSERHFGFLSSFSFGSFSSAFISMANEPIDWMMDWMENADMNWIESLRWSSGRFIAAPRAMTNFFFRAWNQPKFMN